MLCKINLRNLCFEQEWLLGKLVLFAVGRTGRDKYHVWVFTVSVPCTVFNTQTHKLKPSGDKKHATALPSTRIEEKLNIISQFSGIANLSFVFPFSWFLWISIKFQSHLFAVYGYLASEPVLRRHLFHIQPGCRQKSSPFMNLSHHPPYRFWVLPTYLPTYLSSSSNNNFNQRGCGVGECCVGSPLTNDHCPWTSPNLKSNDWIRNWQKNWKAVCNNLGKLGSMSVES